MEMLVKAYLLSHVTVSMSDGLNGPYKVQIMIKITLLTHFNPYAFPVSFYLTI